MASFNKINKVNNLTLFQDKFNHLGDIWKLNNSRIIQCVDKNDSNYVNNILRINNYGFITLDTQLGKFNNNFEIKDIDDEKNTQIRTNYQERAYIKGFIPTRLLKILYSELTQINNSILIIKYQDINKMTNVVLTATLNEFSDGSISCKENYNVNHITGEQTQKELEKLATEQLHLDLNDWTHVIIVDLRWGYDANKQNGLFNSIIKAMISSLDTINYYSN